MKRCPTCRIEKPASEFWKDGSKGDGLSWRCKLCHAAYAKSPERAEYLRQYRKEHARTQNCKDAKRRYRESAKGKEVRRHAARIHETRHPIQYGVRVMVRGAVIAGFLVRPDVCEMCRVNPKPQAHHEDYSKPLDVMWLCPKCHTEIHYDMG